jgi:uncharacterized protein involved in exopolysaccharide biosynthesis
MDEKEIELIDYLNIVWKRKWFIIIATLSCIALTTLISLLLPKNWEIDMIIQPSKFLVQAESGQFEEVFTVDPKQIAGLINQGSYNKFIASELKLDIAKFPKLRAENLRDTKLVRFSLREKNIEMSRSILNLIYDQLKKDFDRKIDVEIKAIDTKIETAENDIKIKLLGISSKEIEKSRTKEQTLSAENRQKISEERSNNIILEMKTVKERIDGIEKQQRDTLLNKKEGTEALGLLLYSNEVQRNLQYYNALDEKLSMEKVTYENLNLVIKENNETIKELNNQIEKIKNEIEKYKIDIELLKEKKQRIDYTKLVKEPTTSPHPVSPKTALNFFMSGLLGLILFTMLAFLFEYIESQKVS